jgi:hypothetical protein
VNPEDIVFGGWDISNMSLADAMTRAKVLDIDLQKQLRPYMESMVPLPGIYDPDFIAANQGSRANNVIKGTKKEQVEQVIKGIRYTDMNATVKKSDIHSKRNPRKVHLSIHGSRFIGWLAGGSGETGSSRRRTKWTR